MRATNDIAFAKSTWSQWKRQIEFVTGFINSTTGLLDIPGLGFIGPVASGSATSCALVQSLNGAAEIATAVGDGVSARSYVAIAQSLSNAINKLLWNHDTGTYALDITTPANFSTASMAFVSLLE